MYNIIFNNNSSENLNLNVTNRPSLPCPSKRLNEIELDGTTETIIEEVGYEDIVFTISFNFIIEDNLSIKFREIKKWLNLIKDNKLILNEFEEICYLVKKTELGNIEREYNLVGEFEVNFICEPFAYLKDSLEFQKINANCTLFNPGDFDTLPVFKIYGNGNINININNNIFSFSETGVVIINSKKELIIKNNDISLVKTIGDYPKLKVGTNNISITGATKIEIQKNIQVF